MSMGKNGVSIALVTSTMHGQRFSFKLDPIHKLYSIDEEDQLIDDAGKVVNNIDLKVLFGGVDYYIDDLLNEKEKEIITSLINLFKKDYDLYIVITDGCFSLWGREKRYDDICDKPLVKIKLTDGFWLECLERDRTIRPKELGIE